MDERIKRVNSLFRVALALFVLAFALLAKVPNEGCHCSETENQATDECPFAKLRQLAATTFVFDAPQVVPPQLIAVPEPYFCEVRLSPCPSEHVYRNRDPPALHYLFDV